MSLVLKDLFPSNFSVNKYVIQSGIGDLFEGEDLTKDLSIKVKYDPTHSVDPNLKIPFKVEFDDLARLHYLSVSRRVTTILEFGTGKSTLVFAKALMENKNKYFKYTSTNLRRGNLYELHPIENSQIWIDQTNSDIPDIYKSFINFNLCRLITDSFCGRLCTYYNGIPNICPDLIYLDGPDQFSPEGDLRGLSTKHQDRMPMSADILTIEHFLQPGTLIVVDGRTANARFLKSNFQRNWSYLHVPEYDQHFFELQEEPLGIYNKKMIDQTLQQN